MKNECYYESYNTCSCPRCEHNEKKCVGAEKCDCYISGTEYFERMMNGNLPEEKPQSAEDIRRHNQKIRENLSLGKSKKQLKYEQRKEDEKNGYTPDGYKLGDDPRFKDLFGKK